MSKQRMTRVPDADPQVWEDFIVTGDEELREKLILHYQPFVVACTKAIGRKVGWIVPYEEMLSTGQIGLLKAFRGYDPSRGSFKKYASTFVYGAIIDAMRSADWLPRQHRIAQRDIQKAAGQLGDGASPREIAEHLGWEEITVLQTLMHVHRADVVSSPNIGALAHSVEGEDGRDIILSVVEGFDRLPADQQIVVALRYYARMSLADISVLLPEVAVSEAHAQAVVALYDEVHAAVI